MWLRWERFCSQCVSGTERERIILLHCRKPKLTERENNTALAPADIPVWHTKHQPAWHNPQWTERTGGNSWQRDSERGETGPAVPPAASSCPPMSWALRNWTPAFAPLRSTCIWSWSRRDWAQATSASHRPKYPPAAPRVYSASSWSTRGADTDAGSPSRTPGKRVPAMERRISTVCCFALLTLRGGIVFMNDTELVGAGWMVLLWCYGSVGCDVKCDTVKLWTQIDSNDKNLVKGRIILSRRHDIVMFSTVAISWKESNPWPFLWKLARFLSQM